MGPPDAHLYRMQLESRWNAEDLRHQAPPLPEPESPRPEPRGARRPIAGLFALFGRFAQRRALGPAR